jgi:hypothetical protein
MEHRNTAIVIALMALLFFSSWLMGEGVTGLYLLDWEQNYCLSNADCYMGEVCCPFYNDQGGVCDLEEKCPSIYRLTMETGGQTSVNTKQTVFNLEQPRSLVNNIALIFLGLILIIIVIIAFTRLHPKNKVKVISIRKKKKKSKKK